MRILLEVLILLFGCLFVALIAVALASIVVAVRCCCLAVVVVNVAAVGGAVVVVGGGLGGVAVVDVVAASVGNVIAVFTAISAVTVPSLLVGRHHENICY